MFSCKNLRKSAQEKLSGKYFKYFLFMTVFVIVNTLTTPTGDDAPFILYLINLAISSIFTVVSCSIDLNISKENGKFLPAIDMDLLKTSFKLLILSLIVGFAVLLGTILLIIPGIIIGLMFSQCFFIVIEDNSKSIIDCLKESCSIMNGNKLDYFILQLYFLPFILLGILTLGIGFFWIVPIIDVTNSNFYLYAKEQKEKVIEE